MMFTQSIQLLYPYMYEYEWTFCYHYLLSRALPLMCLKFIKKKPLTQNAKNYTKIFSLISSSFGIHESSYLYNCASCFFFFRDRKSIYLLFYTGNQFQSCCFLLLPSVFSTLHVNITSLTRQAFRLKKKSVSLSIEYIYISIYIIGIVLYICQKETGLLLPHFLSPVSLLRLVVIPPHHTVTLSFSVSTRLRL